MLAHKPQPGAKHGEQHDYARKARSILDQIKIVLPKAIARLESIDTQWRSRNADRASTQIAAFDPTGLPH